MAYTITLTDGTLLTTINDGTVNSSSTSLTLVGKNYAGYGQFLDTNFVHMLENSSNTTAPTPALCHAGRTPESQNWRVARPSLTIPLSRQPREWRSVYLPLPEG